MIPATKDFIAYAGTVFGPYIFTFNQTKSRSIGNVTVDVVGDKFTLNAHGLANNDQIRFETTDILPIPIDNGVYYFVVSSTTNDFKVSLTSGGAVINLTDGGSGTLTVFKRGTPLDITGWTVRAWAKHVENWDDSIFIDLLPTITDGPNGKVQILVTDLKTITWKYGDHYLSIILKNVAGQWLGPYLVGKLTVRRASTDSGVAPPPNPPPPPT